MTDRPATAAEAMRNCDALLFPQIHILLQLFLTLPLMSATAERSFSTLRRLTSFLPEEHDGSVAPEWSGSDEHQP